MQNQILETTLFCIELFGMFFLLYMGTFIKTKYFRYSKLLFALLLVGALFKITNWFNSDLFFIVGFLGILVMYVLSFIQKPFKNRLDYLKLAWITISIPYKLLIFFHLVGRDYGIITQIIMFFALLEYFRNPSVERDS